MDLRSVLNTSDNGDRAPPKAQTTPQQQHQPRPAPSPAQYSYRDYAQQPPHPSPGNPHHAQQHPGAAAYPPPSPYQGPGQYPAARAPPPSLQPTNSFHDVRSPGSMSGPIQSPYRPISTPTNAPGGGSTGYPFPPAQAPQEMTSPSQRHQYPPGHFQQQQQQQQQKQQQIQAQQQRQRRDSYSQGVAGAYVQQQQQQQQQQQPQHQVPQTPPVVTPGGAPSSHSYLHQRSQSTHSTPTPTSAHSQHQFGPPHAHGSPVVASRPPPPAVDVGSAEHPRQPSQPPTPLGPPHSAASRPSAGHGGFSQPPSPYQHRVSGPGNAQSMQQKTSSNHPPMPTVQPMTSARSSYESPTSDVHRPPSHHDREQSLSVSPRTRVASLASSSERPSLAVSTEAERRPALAAQSTAVDTDNAVTPAKRKLQDRSMSPRELENRDARPPPGEVNGAFVGRLQKSESPVPPRKKRTFRSQPPVWAQSIRSLGNKMPTHANYVLAKRAHGHNHTNGGKPETGTKTERPSRQASPEAARTHASVANNQVPAQPAPEPGPQDILGPWEASITGVKPYEEISKTVADFIFIHVVNNPDFKEIVSRGIQFEIEAKLGTLIDKDTNYRVDKLLDSECVLHDTGRVAFRSSMTEAHHKAFNDFLNQIVIQTDPRAPNTGVARVQVHYKHRREIDRFFDLPLDLQARLPGCMRSRLGSRGRSVRARVTYDQKTGKPLFTIVKARVADIDVHMPSCPMDCRLSINLEMTWDGPVEELEQLASHVDKQPDRNKDRLSYTQGHYQIDLTQVTQTVSGPGNSQRVEKEHELEIELSPGIVIDQGTKAMSGGLHRYQELVEGLLDNVRVLARKAREFS